MNAMFNSGFNEGLSESEDHHKPYPPVVEEVIQKDMPYL